MRGHSPLIRTLRSARARPGANYVCLQCRAVQISASPSTESPTFGNDAFGPPSGSRNSADAQFEVLGEPYSLLSVTLSASQRLYTRRGTLVAVWGKTENAQSTLSLLSPVRRALLGVPFLYQRITSTTPITALIATKSATTTFNVLHLDGTTDWMVAQRNALLAWTGHTLSVRPRAQTGLPLAHWGQSQLTGRGVAALSAPGRIYRVELAAGDEFVAHPASVVAYTVTPTPPLPFRLKSSSLRLQVPDLGLGLLARRLASADFVRNMRATAAYGALARLLFALRTALRRGIFGDRLFLHFRGPATVLMSSRGVRLADSLTGDDVNEIADAEAGVVPRAVELATRATPPKDAGPVVSPGSVTPPPSAVRIASVGPGGKVSFEDTKDLKQFVR